MWISKRDIRSASGRLLDPRVTHYWDSRRAMAKAFRRTLKLDQDAWDVYLIYGPRARWTDPDPPPPDYWMQMLGVPQAPVFDAAEFAARARAELEH
ncbi:MAG: hypothetical protein HZB25_14350 [Candidatus Eisenbacteria bacterium]|nr:hypothetical protein [Candidatus Eisenbacteria bacterium]